MKISGFITNDRSEVHARGQGQRSEVKVTKFKTQLNHFQTVTPVLIHQWLQNYAQSLMQQRKGALLFFKVICQISRSHRRKKNIDFDPNWAFADFNSSLNSLMAMKSCTKLNIVWKGYHSVFQGHLSNSKVAQKKIHDFNPNWAFPNCNSSLNSPMDLKWCAQLDVV